MKDVSRWNHQRIYNEISETSLAAGLWRLTHSLLKHLRRNTRGFGFGSSSIPGGPSQRNSPNWQMISCREEEVHSSHLPPARVFVHHLEFNWACHFTVKPKVYLTLTGALGSVYSACDVNFIISTVAHTVHPQPDFLNRLYDICAGRKLSLLEAEERRSFLV